jgi:tetratricopeptide (TPR) repeat protein
MLYKKSPKPLSGDRVRITAQLIRAANDANIWADTYDRDVQDVLTLQSAVARAIAERIQVEMTPGERQRLQEPRPVNRAALEAYLQGVYHENSIGFGPGLEERHQAANYFREAVRQDPTFARAYVGLAITHIPFVSPSPADAPIVKNALEKALALDPNLSEAHLWMARVKEYYDWDFPAAELEFRRSIELDPNDARARELYGDFLDNMGRLDDGSRQEQIAQALDPEADHLTGGFVVRGDYARSLVILKGVVAANPKNGNARYWVFWSLLHLGKDKEALQELQQSTTLYGHPEMAAPLGKAYADGGRKGLLRLWAKDLERLVPDGVPPAFVGQTYAQLGDADNAFKWAERGYAERDGFLVDLNVQPDWAPLRSDPRFKDLVRRVGLPR